MLFVQDNNAQTCKIKNMWYRTAKEKFLYSPVIRKRNVSPFAAEEDPDKLEEINVSENPELLPEDLTDEPQKVPQESPEIEPIEIAPQAPILIDNIDPQIQSDNINKSTMPPPKSPHDGCRCRSKIRQKISGGYEWQIDDSMCADCQAAAREYNRQTMDLAGVNEPLAI